MRKNRSKNTYIPVVATVILLFVTFMVTLLMISERPSNGFTVDDSEAYEGVSSSGFEFVETEGKNGVKYYVITRSTSEASSDGGEVTDAAAEVHDNTTETTASTAKKSTKTTKARRNSDQKIAYLTFDDGPSINTMKLLDVLDEYDVKATFFVIYHKNMEKRYKAIVERGHTIALHSYTHSYAKIYKTEKGYYQDLNKIHDYVEKVTGVDSHIIRFPGGSSNTVSRKYNKTIMATLKQSVTDNGYIFHDWNIDSTDASGINRDPDLLVEKVTAGLKKKKPVVNILMHDTGKSKTTTVEALPRIIEAVKAQGYQIEPLTEESEAIQHNW